MTAPARTWICVSTSALITQALFVLSAHGSRWYDELTFLGYFVGTLISGNVHAPNAIVRTALTPTTTTGDDPCWADTMRQLSQIAGRRIWIGSLARPYQFQSPFGGEPFVLLLNVVAQDVTPEEQGRLSAGLVAQGCCYAVCAGHRCSTWDDSVDMAFLETHREYEPSDEHFVMTSWHDGEAMSDIVAFFLMNTSFDNYTARNFLALDIGGNDRSVLELEKALEAIRRAEHH